MTENIYFVQCGITRPWQHSTYKIFTKIFAEWMHPGYHSHLKNEKKKKRFIEFFPQIITSHFSIDLVKISQVFIKTSYLVRMPH